MMTRCLLIGLMMCASAAQIRAQETLAEHVENADVGWMFGKWQAESENGAKFNLDVAWELDKHAILFHGKSSDLEFKGYTIIEPGSEQPKYWAIDNHGAVSKGSWNKEGDEMVLRLDTLIPDSNPRKMAAVFSGSASEGLKVQLCQISDTGELVKPARSTFNFKKQ